MVVVAKNADFVRKLQNPGFSILLFYCTRRAKESHIQPSLSSAASTFTGSTVSLRVDNAPSSTAAQAPEVAAGSSAPDQDVTVDSDAESVDTTAAFVFAPVNKMKKAIEKRKALAMALGQSSSTH